MKIYYFLSVTFGQLSYHINIYGFNENVVLLSNIQKMYSSVIFLSEHTIMSHMQISFLRETEWMIIIDVNLYIPKNTFISQ